MGSNPIWGTLWFAGSTPARRTRSLDLNKYSSRVFLKEC